MGGEFRRNTRYEKKLSVSPPTFWVQGTSSCLYSILRIRMSLISPHWVNLHATAYTVRREELKRVHRVNKNETKK